MQDIPCARHGTLVATGGGQRVADRETQTFNRIGEDRRGLGFNGELSLHVQLNPFINAMIGQRYLRLQFEPIAFDEDDDPDIEEDDLDPLLRKSVLRTRVDRDHRQPVR